MDRHVTASRTVALALVSVLAACSDGDSADPPAPTATTSSTSSASSEPASPEPTPSAFAGAWRDVTAEALGETADWTNKVELADLDRDGDVDLLFANGGEYDTPGTPVASRAYLNAGDGTFEDATRQVFGATKALARVVKVAELDGDGFVDVVLGTAYGTQSRLFLGGADGFTDATRTHLPRARLSVGDLEPGDVDRDGDLDLVLADWGEGSPMQNTGGRVRLWLNDGAGHFTDASDRMPKTLVMFSWDLEQVDVDNDWDLDLAVSCKTCPTSLIYLNDGRGRFTDESERRMPAFTNNYDFTPLDLDADGFLDLLTVNDGESRPAGLAEHAFRNDGTGRFVDVTEEWWPEDSNPGYDDNIVIGLDVESDGDADFVVGSLDGPDRLLVNDGAGRLTLADDVFDADPSRGTLGMGLADLDGDARVDVVESQGEVDGYVDERVYLGTDVLAPDTASPVVRAEVAGGTVLARVHDNRTPYIAADWASIVVRWQGGRRPMTWYGENLFTASIPPRARGVEVCATDAAGNETCQKPRG